MNSSVTGVPNELHSDQGRNCESTVLDEFCKLLDIKKTRTTLLSKQSDEMVKRFHWTLGQELTKQCSDGQSSWGSTEAPGAAHGI